MEKTFSFDPGVGVAATCWAIIGYSVDYNQQVLQVSVGGWVNTEARQAGLQPLCSHIQEFSKRAFDEGIQEWVRTQGSRPYGLGCEIANNLMFDFGTTITEAELWARLEKTAFFAQG